MLDRFNEYTLSYVRDNSESIKRPELFKKGEFLLVKPKRFDSPSLLCVKEMLRNLIENNWSRVQLRESSEKQLTLFFCDHGFEIDFTPSCKSEYDFIMMPIYSKICPLFVYECVLNRKSFVKKISQAKAHNKFCDDLFFNDYISKA